MFEQLISILRIARLHFDFMPLIYLTELKKDLQSVNLQNLPMRKKNSKYAAYIEVK